MRPAPAVPNQAAKPPIATGETVVISINASWNIVNFRPAIVRALAAEGYRVVALTPADAYADKLAALGIEHVPLEMDIKGISPAADLSLLWRYHRILRRLRPAAFLGYTIKPNIYGSLAAQRLGIPVINNVSGLGTAFIRRGWLNRAVVALYRIALRRSATVFFQNHEDRDLFLSERIVAEGQARLLPGSGIDLNRFSPSAGSGRPGPTFLLIARLLRDKGVVEFVEAARALRGKLPQARFQLLGVLDAPNRTAIRREEVEAWEREGIIEYLGETDDVRPFIAAADCIVLPSYREGLPRVLLEGGAMGKPLIATDVPGCRHVVQDGVNGYLCAARDASSLAAAMERLAELGEDDRTAMGARARRMVEERFDERLVTAGYLAALRDALSSR